MIKRSFLISFVFTFFAFAPRSFAQQDDPHYSTEELVAALTQSLTSIDSLDCEFTYTAKQEGEPVQVHRNRYARIGARWHKTFFQSGDEDNSIETQRIVCFDGKRAYSYGVVPLPDGTIHNQSVQIHDTHSQPLISPEYLIGIMLPDFRRSILDLIAENDVVSRSIDDSSGNPVYRLALQGVSFSNATYDVTCDLASGRDFLPSRLTVEYDAKKKASSPSHRDWSQTWVVAEFAQVLDEATGDQRWFPKMGRLVQGTVYSDGKAYVPPLYELFLDKVRINANLDESLFNPNVVAGTNIFDMTAEGKGRVSLAGGPGEVDKRIGELSQSSHDFVDRRSFWFYAGILSFGCVSIFYLLRSKQIKT